MATDWIEEPASEPVNLSPPRSSHLSVQRAGRAANEQAARATFADYRSRKARNTLLQHDVTLAQFARYLARATGGEAPGGEALASDPGAWRGVTWGLVDGFVRWLLLQGYAMATVNTRLSVVKVYAKLAAKAGTLETHTVGMISLVGSYSRREGRNIDARREEARIPTRVGDKKARPVSITPEQARALKDQPDTPEGRRDRLMLCLLLDHGLRVGEAAGLAVSNLDVEAGLVSFYRPKVDIEQIHRLTPDTLEAARAYLDQDALPTGPLLRRNRRGGRLGKTGMTERGITGQVHRLGERIGIDGLSAHDLRHHWATQAARNGTPLDRLQDAGGWASPKMPLRYVERSRIANEGVRLGE